MKGTRVPLDEYPRRCIKQIEDWKKMRGELVNNEKLEHEKSREFASFIINAMENDVPYRIHGNVLNHGIIPNLPPNACVEVPCLVDRAGIHPCYVGEPSGAVCGDQPHQYQCAATDHTGS